MVFRRLKIHADPASLAAGQPHNVMLFPFWGKSPEPEGFPDTGRFDEYAARGGELFEMTSLHDADVAVLAGEWKAGGGTNEALAFCDRAKRAGKQVLIFFNNDSDEEIPVDAAIIFRTSGYRSRSGSHVHGLPAWCEDFVAVYRSGRLPIRSRASRPVAGYCGYGVIRRELPAPLASVARHIPGLRRWADPFGGSPGAVLRSRALSRLARASEVDTNFVLRNAFWAGAVVGGQLDAERARRARAEYVENMFGSDYVLCARGTGNFSFRLYETLCSGRIPLFIDSDCIMPHERWIDWSRATVRLDAQDVGAVAERLVAFHAGLSPRAFEDLQRSCRQLWIEWIAPLGFFSQLHRYLD